jgi:RNA polymerase sigma-70 factor (ECF subfamily)
MAGFARQTGMIQSMMLPQQEAAVSPDVRSGNDKAVISIFATEAAFRAWYDVAMPRVYAYLFARVDSDAALAEELTQQTFTEAVASKASFAGRSEPTTWVIAIARHRLADHYRRHYRDQHRQASLIERANLGGRDPWQRAEAFADVRRALSGLPGEQRVAFVLRVVDGLSVREVAATIGRSEDATESLLRRARISFDHLVEHPNNA